MCNYRSVPSILNVYSDLFYDASLIAEIDGVDSEDAKILNSVTRILPNNKTNGVVFIGVNGKNERCSDSPSWYNKSEAEHVSVKQDYRAIFVCDGKFTFPDKEIFRKIDESRQKTC